MDIKIPRGLLNKFNVKEEWFEKDPDSIHGVLHAYRVLILSFLISKKEGVNEEDLCYAAIFHDTKRYSDYHDPEHSFRAANWLSRFNISRIDKIEYLVRWHAPEDNEVPLMTKDLECFKDADALDRCRTGDLDSSRLRSKSAKNMLDFSFRLFKKTEEQKKYTKSYRDNIVKTLESLDVLD